MEHQKLERKARSQEMNTWAPLFSKIVDSSIWLEPDFVVKVFITMLAKKDADQVVRGSAFNISQWAKKTEAETLKALKILAAPDSRRLEPQPFEGRRIEKVADGWLILNGQSYEEMMRKVNRREYKRIKQAEYRKNARGGETHAQRTAGQAAENGDHETERRIQELEAKVPPGTFAPRGTPDSEDPTVEEYEP